MDIDEHLFVVSEAVRMCREFHDQRSGAAWSGKSVGLLEDGILRDMLESPNEMLCAFIAITMHMKRSHGLPGPTTLDEMAQAVQKRLAVAPDAYVETIALQIQHIEERKLTALEIEYARTRRALEMREVQDKITMAKINTEDTLASTKLCASVYDKIVLFIARAARTSEDESTRMEIRSALESVFPVYGVRSFCLEIVDDKVKQLGELCRLVVGICLLNKATGKSRSGILGTPQRDVVRRAQSAAWTLVVYLRQYSSLASNARKRWARAAPKSEEGDNLAQVVMLAEQCMAILKEQGELLADLATKAEASAVEMEATLADLRDKISGQTAVSKDVVYPLFDQIGRSYLESLDFELQMDAYEAMRLIKPSKDTIELSASDYEVMPPAKFIRRFLQAEDAEDASIDSTEGGHEGAGSVDENVKVLEAWPEGAAEAAYKTFEYGGYCPVSIVEDQLIRRGNPACGACVLDSSFTTSGSDEEGKKPRDKVFVFASHRYLAMFAKTPGRYTAQVTIACSTKLPQLIHLLRLKMSRTSVQYVCDLMSKSDKKKEYGTQTLMHVVDRHMDPSYEWNEWALRRRALAMTNLRQKKTHSSQTNKSHFRREIETQVYLQKENDTQTNVSAVQGMPRHIKHITGLRGDADTKMKIVELKLDLGQPHEH